MKIYVGNLAYEASEDQVRRAFEVFGQVDQVELALDPDTDTPRGFAFVLMPNQAEAEAAIQGMNLQQICGRTVTVNRATFPDE